MQSQFSEGVTETSKLIGTGALLLLLLASGSSTFATDVPVPNGGFQTVTAGEGPNPPDSWYVNSPVAVHIGGLKHDTPGSVSLNANGAVLRNKDGITQVHAGDIVTFTYWETISEGPGGYTNDVYLIADPVRSNLRSVRVKNMEGSDWNFGTPCGAGYCNTKYDPKNPTGSWEKKTVSWTVSPEYDDAWLGIEFLNGNNGGSYYVIDDMTLDVERAPEPAGLLKIAANKAMIDKVAAGKLKKAKASWWGFNETDSTKALQAAINSGVPKLIIPNMGKPWIVRPIKLAGNQIIVLEKGVEVQARRGAFNSIYDTLFRADDKENVTLVGPGATLRMHRDDYADPKQYRSSEFRSALQITRCTNVNVSGLTLAESGGDGILVDQSKNVHVRNCTMDKNYRQGISLISGENILVENCVMKNTAGTAPAGGIDIEPDTPEEKLVNIVVRNCVAENNQGPGMFTFLGAQSTKSAPISIRFEKCVALKSGQDGFGVHQIRGNTGIIEFIDCAVDGAGQEGIRVHRCGDSPADPQYGPNCKVRLVRCSFRNTAIPALRFGGGGAEFVDCVIEDNNDRPFLDMAGRAVHDITGQVTVINPFGSRMSVGEGSTGITLKVVEKKPNRR